MSALGLRMSNATQRHQDAWRAFTTILPPHLRGPAFNVPMRLQTLPPRSWLSTERHNSADVHFVLRGWVGTRATLGEKLRPLCHLSMRGDCVGLGQLASTELDAPLEAHMTQSVTEIVSIPVSALNTLMERHPGWRSFVLDELVRQTRIHHLIHAVTGGMVAPDRVIHFYHLMACRHRAATGQSGAVMPMPLTQGEIGELLGLTNVSVNRALRALEGKEMLNNGRDSVTLLNESAWVPELAFDYTPAEMRQVFGRPLSRFD